MLDTVLFPDVEKGKVIEMDIFSRRFHNRIHRRLVELAQLLSQLLARLRPNPKEFAVNRMCPFCGLITPRARESCLECHRAFNVA
jgi:hypothetical protein